MDKPKHHRNSTIRNASISVWIIIAILALFVVSAISCYLLLWTYPPLICFDSLIPTNTDVEHNAYFEFPQTANDIFYTSNGVNRKGGCTIWVSFEMESQDLEMFKESTLVADFEQRILDEGAIHYFLERLGWHQPIDSLAGYGWSPDISVYFEQWIFIETLSNGNYRVYIITNEEWL